MVTGLLLAAGAGTRIGTPKALLHDADGTSWLQRAVAVLREGGCDRVTVVLGAAVDEARLLVPADTGIVVAEDWVSGMGASLRAGLAALAEDPDEVAALVSLVDLTDLGPEVAARLLAGEVTPTTLRRAAYEGQAGHPVLLGRAHWDGVTRTATGDRGARAYLAAHEVELVECGDLASGRDVDHR